MSARTYAPQVRGYEKRKADQADKKEGYDMKLSIKVVTLITGEVGQVISDRDGEILWQSEPFNDAQDCELFVTAPEELARMAADSKIKSVLIGLFAGDIPATEAV